MVGPYLEPFITNHLAYTNTNYAYAYSCTAVQLSELRGAGEAPLSALTAVVRVAGPRRVGRAESRATVVTDAWTPWDAYTDVLR